MEVEEDWLKDGVMDDLDRRLAREYSETFISYI